MEITWSPLSIENLEKIGDFIALDSKSRSITFINEVINSVERLSKFPESGMITAENPLFRQLVYKKYRVIYRLKSNTVEIVTVLSPKQETTFK